MVEEEKQILVLRKKPEDREEEQELKLHQIKQEEQEIHLQYHLLKVNPEENRDLIQEELHLMVDQLVVEDLCKQDK